MFNKSTIRSKHLKKVELLIREEYKELLLIIVELFELR